MPPASQRAGGTAEAKTAEAKTAEVKTAEFTPEQRRALVFKCFDEAQRSFTCHRRGSADIAETWKEDAQSLAALLKRIVEHVLLKFKREAPVERTCKFIVKVVTNPNNGQEWSDVLVNSLVQMLLMRWNAKNKAVRFRICELIGGMLNEMDEDAEIDEDLWNKLEEKLLLRMKDKCPQVRRSAAIALNRLQVPDEEDDKVMASLVNMMDHDANKECRREALVRLDVNKRTLVDILRRVRDISDDVRKAAFEKLCQVDIVSLTIHSRVTILKSGLTERVEKVKAACSKLLVERWLGSRKGDLVSLLKLLDIENREYHDDITVIIKHILRVGAPITVDAPPYTAETLTPEKLFYWRVLCSHLKEVRPTAVDDVMPSIMEFCQIIDANMTHVNNLSHLLRLAMFLDFKDEFGKAELAKQCKAMLVTLDMDDLVVPLVMKILRRIYRNEDDYMTLVLEVISDVRHPLEEPSPADDERARQLLEEQLVEYRKDRERADEEKKVAVQTEDFQTAQLVKQRIKDIDSLIEGVERQLFEKENKEQVTWERVLKITSNLLEFTSKNHKNTRIAALLESTLIPAVTHNNPCIRGPGITAFSLFHTDTKEHAQTVLRHLSTVVQNDQLALQYLALKCLFDMFLMFNFNKPTPKPPIAENEEEDPESKQSEVPAEEEDDEKAQQNEQIVQTMADFLSVDNADLQQCAVEGFTKLLFNNKLKHHHERILEKLILLYYNPESEKNDHIRQCLSMFFPHYASTKSRYREHNRNTLRKCLMPCLKTVAYAPKSSPLSKIALSKMTEYLLWLLEADPLSEKARVQTVSPADSMTIHEEIAFDVLYHIDAHPTGFGIKTLCRMLTILRLNPESQHNIKQFRYLLTEIRQGGQASLRVPVERRKWKVEDKRSMQYLKKFEDRLAEMDATPETALDADKRQELQARQVIHIKDIQDREAEYIQGMEEAAQQVPEEAPPSRSRFPSESPTRPGAKRKLNSKSSPNRKRKKQKHDKSEETRIDEDHNALTIPPPASAAKEPVDDIRVDLQPSEQQEVDLVSLVPVSEAPPNPKSILRNTPKKKKTSQAKSKTSKPAKKGTRKRKPKAVPIRRSQRLRKPAGDSEKSESQSPDSDDAYDGATSDENADESPAPRGRKRQRETDVDESTQSASRNHKRGREGDDQEAVTSRKKRKSRNSPELDDLQDSDDDDPADVFIEANEDTVATQHQKLQTLMEDSDGDGNEVKTSVNMDDAELRDLLETSSEDEG